MEVCVKEYVHVCDQHCGKLIVRNSGEGMLTVGIILCLDMPVQCFRNGLSEKKLIVVTYSGQ
jgi:hypothetical protein